LEYFGCLWGVTGQSTPESTPEISG
jgi:hypothetical protein